MIRHPFQSFLMLTLSLISIGTPQVLAGFEISSSTSFSSDVMRPRKHRPLPSGGRGWERTQRAGALALSKTLPGRIRGFPVSTPPPPWLSYSLV